LFGVVHEAGLADRVRCDSATGEKAGGADGVPKLQATLKAPEACSFRPAQLRQMKCQGLVE